MSKYSFGRKHWRNPDSKYAYAPDDQLDKDIKAHQERKGRKKDTIQAMVEGMMKSDPTRQEETFQMFVETLKEWREKHE